MNGTIGIERQAIGARNLHDAAGKAAPLLRNIDRERVNQLVGDAHWDASLDVALAEVALAKGDRDEAKARLRAAAAVYTNPPSDRYLARRVARLHSALGI